VTFKLPKIRSTNDVDLLLVFGFKVRLTNVGSMDSETIELGKEDTDAQAAKQDHARVHTLGRNISEMSSSHERSFLTPVVLDVVHKVYSDLLVSFRSRAPFPRSSNAE